ncbi:MAG: hypothetical protein WBB28_25845 [Crinalium sp.]
MKYEFSSEENYIINGLKIQLENQKTNTDIPNKKKEAYLTNFAVTLSELVKYYMREMAQDNFLNVETNSLSLLNLAIQQAKDIINEQIKINNLVDLDKYFKEIREDLKFPAKEIYKLKTQLYESKQSHKIGESKPVDLGNNLSFKIKELGLKNFIEALILIPTNEYQINLDNTDYLIVGEWFPFEICTEEFVYVVDDDGSLYVSVEKLPQDLIKKAKEIMIEIAEQIYV